MTTAAWLLVTGSGVCLLWAIGMSILCLWASRRVRVLRNAANEALEIAEHAQQILRMEVKRKPPAPFLIAEDEFA